MNSTVFLIDGFNLYHSIVDLGKDTHGSSFKWLNIRSLCESYLYKVGNNAQLKDIFYFSAVPNYLISSDPGKVQRHELYLEALKSTNIKVILGRFKRHEALCHKCNNKFWYRTEKRTDVSISSKIFEIFITTQCNTLVLISGDTDLVPAIETAKRLFHSINLIIIFPYKRMHKELANMAEIDNFYTIKPKRYLKHQFDDPVELPDGTKISKPPSW